MNKVELLKPEKQEIDQRSCLCPICETQFYIQNRKSYTYKCYNKNNFIRYMCSWTCYNKASEMIKRSIKVED